MKHTLLFTICALLLVAGCDMLPGSTSDASNNSADTIVALEPTPVAWTGRSVIITELLTHTDAPLEDSIELFNPTDAAINIGGWYLTDDPTIPRQVQLSADTTIPPQSYMVLTQRNWGTGFALSEYGEPIYLYATDVEGNLTGYVDGGEFGAAPNGQSFGRMQTAIATEFVLLEQRTLGAPNAQPMTGPIIFSEIMYEGGGPTNEYIVLENITDEDVPLYYPGLPDLVWELNGGADYAFPPSSVLPARSKLIISRLDPELFRISGINLPESIQLFGPYTGKLKNSGERIEIIRPDKPDTDFIPYVLVDSVTYADTAPWPLLLADGSMAIRRISAERYGNNPENWEPVVLSSRHWQ